MEHREKQMTTVRALKRNEYWKLARPDGWDFHTGKTINYRDALRNGGVVNHPAPDATLGLCSSGVLHASKNIHDCFQGARIPCSVFLVSGRPALRHDPTKHGFASLSVVEELEPASVFGWRYQEAAKPVDPFRDIVGQINPGTMRLLTVWASVWASVGNSVWDSVWDSVRGSWWDSVRDSWWDSVRGSWWDSVRASVWAYTGWLFAPVITKWRKRYPYQSAVDLWHAGLVPSFDGNLWRLHAGPKAKTVWKGTIP